MTARTEATLIEEVVTDKGYHSDDVLTELHERGVRGYIAEPDRGSRRWEDRPEEQARVYANRRRIRGTRGRRLHRKRAELAERSNAHMYETGGMRHLYLRGCRNIEKRVLIHGAGFNLGLLMRKKFGVGKPRCLQGTVLCVFQRLSRLVACMSALLLAMRALHVTNQLSKRASGFSCQALRAAF